MRRPSQLAQLLLKIRPDLSRSPRRNYLVGVLFLFVVALLVHASDALWSSPRVYKVAVDTRSGAGEVVEVASARFLSPGDLLAAAAEDDAAAAELGLGVGAVTALEGDGDGEGRGRHGTEGEDEEPVNQGPLGVGVIRGDVPRLIHQSWMDADLPIKFKRWSDTWRIKHPAWRWVLWTDRDNEALVRRHPEILPVYRALKNGIQRADFVRNLYMWEFGGIYADLDMESLRSFDTLLSSPQDYLSPKYPSPSDLAHGHPLAFIGGMDTRPGEWEEHGLPNAFMASPPRHPMWLFPLARVMAAYEVEFVGDRPYNNHTNDGAEDTTGPVALSRALGAYHEYARARGGDGEGGGGARTSLEKVLPRVLHAMAAQASARHDVAVFDDGVIYPFSWVAQVAGVGDNWHCMAAEGTGWDPLRCLATTKAYERGAHAITYWTHSWSQDDEQKHLKVVGSDD